MTERPAISPRRIGHFYDLMGQFLDEVYGDNIHYGYWDDEATVASMAEAQLRLTDVLTERLRLAPGQHVLDVGCGTGGPALRLARTTGASVLGVTISRWQVSEAALRAAAAGLDGTVQFAYADVGDMPFPDDSFDGAMSLETLVHITDKSAALRELRRVLRPGARLVLADLTRNAPMNAEQRGIWAGWPVAPALTGDEYADLLADAGFAVEEVRDCSRETSRTFASLREVLDRPAERLGAVYGEQTLARARQGVRSLVDVSEQCLGYHIFVGRKPLSRHPHVLGPQELAYAGQTTDTAVPAALDAAERGGRG
jgi:cyclopropane fatty-acyl-phospholipid synthase-like methyltransferase